MNNLNTSLFRVHIQLFDLGQIVATPGVLEETTEHQRTEALKRHIRGDWGILCAEDKSANFQALRDGSRLLSAYQIDPARPDGAKFWIITEADRSVTTFLLPSEY